jgi:uncharacterized membrane protein
MRTWLSLAAVSALFLSGCTESPEGGTPGTAASFKITGPPIATNIKQGNQETVKCSVDRKSEFKKDVKLSLNAPERFKATLSKDMIKASDGDTDFTVTIAVEGDAAIGDHIVKVTGTPEGGAATSLDLKVKVDKR